MAASNSAKSNTGNRRAPAKGGKRPSTGSSQKRAGGSGGRRPSSSAPSRNRERVSRVINDDAEKALSPARQREIMFFVYLAVAVFMICSNFGICGAVGRVFSGFFFGIFGWSQYLIPFYLFAAAAFLLSNGPKKSIIRKLIWGAVILMLTSWIFQLTYGAADMTAGTLYSAGYDEHRGGGVFFGGILVLLYKLIGKVGVIILTVLASIVAVIQITGISLIELIKGAFTYGYSGEDDEDYDGDEDYPEEAAPARPASRRRMDIENGLKVLPEEQPSEDIEPKKRGRKKKKEEDEEERLLPKEEMTELRPDPFQDDLEELKAAARRKVEVEKAAAQRGSDKQAYAPERTSQTAAGNLIPEEPDRGLSIPSSLTIGQGAPTGRTVAEGGFAGGNAGAYTEPVSVPEEDVKPEYASAGSTETPERKSENVDFFTLKPAFEDPLGDSWDEKAWDKPLSVEAEDGFPQPKSAAKSAPAKKPLIDDDYDSNRDSAFDLEDDPLDAEAIKAKNMKATEEKVTHSDTLRELAEIQQSVEEKPEPPKKPYKFPPISLLNPPKSKGGKNDQDVRDTAMKLKSTLESFGVNVTITDYSRGPSVTRYELTPESGVKVSRILSLQDDIKLSLAAADIRIEAPIPGKSAIGIEVPNKEKQMVSFRELIDTDSFRNSKSKISFAIGKDIGGQTVIGDIAKMPHMLIAGSTGSGKSVCINTILMSILYKAKPEEVRLIMVDPKMVELTVYNGIPHLLIPVVTDAKKAAGALNWAVQEMERRYKLFARHNVRNLEGFNKKVEEEGPIDPEDITKADLRFMPQIVVVVDELADLMMVAHGEVEDAIVRLSQLARAAGIHLIIATQRPSVDVITGLIKANVPSRIAFMVSSGTDSRTILDTVGAEKLLGKGDMLYAPTGLPKPIRVQGAFVSDDEVLHVTDFIKNQCGDMEYDENIAQSIDAGVPAGGAGSAPAEEEDEKYDEYFEEAGRLVIEKDKASIGYLQRVFRIGFNRAARIMDQLADAGVVGPEEGTKPRKVLMTMDEFEEFISL